MLVLALPLALPPVASASVVAIAATAAFPEVDLTLRRRGAHARRRPAARPRALGKYGATSIVAHRPTSLPIALVVALSADGVPRALALAEAFVVLTALAVGLAAIVRRRPA